MVVNMEVYKIAQKQMPLLRCPASIKLTNQYIKQEIRTHFLPELSSDFSSVVEHMGLEPMTSTLPV